MRWPGIGPPSPPSKPGSSLDSSAARVWLCRPVASMWTNGEKCCTRQYRYSRLRAQGRGASPSSRSSPAPSTSKDSAARHLHRQHRSNDALSADRHELTAEEVTSLTEGSAHLLRSRPGSDKGRMGVESSSSLAGTHGLPSASGNMTIGACSRISLCLQSKRTPRPSDRNQAERRPHREPRGY